MSYDAIKVIKKKKERGIDKRKGGLWYIKKKEVSEVDCFGFEDNSDDILF
jgi:hypothetical protein